MSNTIYKHWFIDYEFPNEHGKPYKSSGGTMIDSEMGLIPYGWHVSHLIDIADIIDCLHSIKPKRIDKGFPLLQLWNIRDDGLLDMSDTYYIDEQQYKKWISRIEITQGDCVITNVGRVGAVSQVPKGFRAAMGRNMTAIRLKSDFPYPTYLIECLLSESMQIEISRKTDAGTVLDALNVKNIPKLRFTKPPPEVLIQYEALTRPIREFMELHLSDINSTVNYMEL
jgi:type I restriction enzyme S subunit